MKGAIKAGGLAPVGLLDAGEYEIASAIASIVHQAGILVGRAGEYDQLRDEYTVVGKSIATGKAQDFKISGDAVADVIKLTRWMNGGKFVPGAGGGPSRKRVRVAV